MTILRKCQYEILADETARLLAIAENNDKHIAARADAYLELAHLHQRTAHQCWGYIRKAQDLLRGWS